MHSRRFKRNVQACQKRGQFQTEQHGADAFPCLSEPGGSAHSRQLGGSGRKQSFATGCLSDTPTTVLSTVHGSYSVRNARG